MRSDLQPVPFDRGAIDQIATSPPRSSFGGAPAVTDSIIILGRAYFDLCLFRRRPQDLPASQWLMGITLAVYAAAGMALLPFELGPRSALLAALTDLLLLWGGTLLLLQLFRHPRRSTQTITALAGAGVIITILALPVAFWLTYSHERGFDITLPSLLWLLLFGWNVFVTARILQHALSTNFAIGLLIAFAFILASQQVIGMIVPAPAAP